MCESLRGNGCIAGTSIVIACSSGADTGRETHEPVYVLWVRALFTAGIAVVVGCGGPTAALPVVSTVCIKDATAYNRTISEEFRHPTAKPNAEPPLEVSRELIEGRRVSGDTAIRPDDMTTSQMADLGVIETTASFALCLDTAGVPVSVSRMSSTCFPRYDEKIRTAMLTWRYSPYSVDGVPKEVCTTINFLYRQPRRRR